MRSYLSFPRGARIPSPRILIYAGDGPERASRALQLANALTEEFGTGSIVLASGAAEAARLPCSARVEVVKLPSLTPEAPQRPLARERVRRLRQKLLSTLFDVFLPDLVLVDTVGPEAELEARLLLQRARALQAATLLGIGHEGSGSDCPPLAGAPMAAVCKDCRRGIRAAAREALANRERSNRWS